MGNKSTTFEINFYEFAFLVEACIPPTPIARAFFWQNVINIYYHDMTSEEREHLFNWITKNNSFDIKNEDCELFYSRYNPDNQYSITTEYNGETGVLEAFKHKEKYYIEKDVYINDEHIKNIKKYSYE